jgi:hypothetical protein
MAPVMETAPGLARRHREKHREASNRPQRPAFARLLWVGVFFMFISFLSAFKPNQFGFIFIK